jgi:hypothetical protein
MVVFVPISIMSRLWIIVAFDVGVPARSSIAAARLAKQAGLENRMVLSLDVVVYYWRLEVYLAGAFESLEARLGDSRAQNGHP